MTIATSVTSVATVKTKRNYCWQDLSFDCFWHDCLL